MPHLTPSASLDNIKKQFKQDRLLTFKGFVFDTDLESLRRATGGQPIDKDGYPAPIAGDDCMLLAQKLEEQYALARRLFIERCSALEIRSLGRQKVQHDEHVE